MALIVEKKEIKPLFSRGQQADVIQFGKALNREEKEAILKGISTPYLFNELIRRLKSITRRFEAISGLVGGKKEINPEIMNGLRNLKENYMVLESTLRELNEDIRR